MIPSPFPSRSTSTATEGVDDATFGGMPDADRRLHPDPADATGSFGSPDSTAGGIVAGGVSPEMKGDKHAVGARVPAADSFSSPHRTQGAPGHVAKVVDWVENEANKPQPVPDRSALSPVRVSSPLAPATTTTLLPATSDDRDPRSPRASWRVRGRHVRRASAHARCARRPRDARRGAQGASQPEDGDGGGAGEELAMARREPLALDDPPPTTRRPRNDDERAGVDEATVEVRVVDPYDFDAFVEEEERERAEREMSLARRMSPLSATPPGDPRRSRRVLPSPRRASA